MSKQSAAGRYGYAGKSTQGNACAYHPLQVQGSHQTESMAHPLEWS